MGEGWPQDNGALFPVLGPKPRRTPLASALAPCGVSIPPPGVSERLTVSDVTSAGRENKRQFCLQNTGGRHQPPLLSSPPLPPSLKTNFLLFRQAFPLDSC